MSTATIIAPVCPECQAPMVLKVTRRFNYPNGEPRKFWSCSRWPDCRAAHGAHPNGQPLGTPATLDGKLARRAAHVEFDALMHERKWSRSEAYRWLAREMLIDREECHIGSFDKEQCGRVVEIVKAAREKDKPHG